MIESAVTSLMNDISKKKEKWFLETLEKHNLITGNNLTNCDFYWLSEEMGIRVVIQDNKTSIYQDNKLLGEWIGNPKLINAGDNTYKLEAKCWN
jgi:hypothetical protein